MERETTLEYIQTDPNATMTFRKVYIFVNKPTDRICLRAEGENAGVFQLPLSEVLALLRQETI